MGGRHAADGPSGGHEPVPGVGAITALAFMHRMWLDGTDFRWQRELDAPAGAAA
jgi:hypothetical protein